MTGPHPPPGVDPRWAAIGGSPYGQPAPRPPVPTSAAATASLVLAILGSMCLPLIGGVAAVLLGVVALVDIKSSEGKKGGTVAAVLGLVIGGGTTAAYVALIALLVAAPSSGPVSPPLPPATPYLPPTSPGPAPGLPSPGPGITMTVEPDTLETAVGKITVVDIGLGEQTLETALRAQRSAAIARNQKLVMHTTAAECRPCLGVAAALADPKMQRALEGVRLVRVDVGDFHEELGMLGVPDQLIPAFFLLDGNMTPTDGVTGGEWDDDEAANIAPVLDAFVRGKPMRRRYPWKAPVIPKPRGTIL